MNMGWLPIGTNKEIHDIAYLYVCANLANDLWAAVAVQVVILYLQNTL